MAADGIFTSLGEITAARAALTLVEQQMKLGGTARVGIEDPAVLALVEALTTLSSALLQLLGQFLEPRKDLKPHMPFVLLDMIRGYQDMRHDLDQL